MLLVGVANRHQRVQQGVHDNPGLCESVLEAAERKDNCISEDGWTNVREADRYYSEPVLKYQQLR